MTFAADQGICDLGKSDLSELGFSGLAILCAVIAHSQIVLPQPLRAARGSVRQLPAGFEDADIAVLDWIAAEGRRTGRHLLPI
jgi:hypothetical protein